jgi:hypothetical protein
MMSVEAIMTGFAVLAVISLIGTVAVVGWVGLVSLGIRREDRGAVINRSAVGLNGTGPGRIARMARQTTGVHWV